MSSGFNRGNRGKMHAEVTEIFRTPPLRPLRISSAISAVRQ